MCGLTLFPHFYQLLVHHLREVNKKFKEIAFLNLRLLFNAQKAKTSSYNSGYEEFIPIEDNRTVLAAVICQG
jgi:hypothetical protein